MLALAVGVHVQACFAKEADVCAGIGDATIVTKEQVEAAFTAVPTSYQG